MTEKEKMLLGMIYDANNDSALIADRMACKELCRNYNDLRPKDMKGRESLLHKIFGSIKGGILIEQPFYCDYGYNIVVGKNFYANFNLVILDEGSGDFRRQCFHCPQLWILHRR